MPREQSGKTQLNIRVTEDVERKFHKLFNLYKAKNREVDQSIFMDRMLELIKSECNPSYIL